MAVIFWNRSWALELIKERDRNANYAKKWRKKPPLELLFCFAANLFFPLLADIPPVDLYKISEKSICKNQAQQTGILVYCKLDLYCLCSLQKSISKLIFVGYTGSKNPVWSRMKIHFVELDFFKLIFQKSSTDQQWVRRFELFSH